MQDTQRGLCCDMAKVVKAGSRIVPSQHDLVKSKPSVHLLEVWLGIVALGGNVRAANTSQSQAFAASAREVAASVNLSAEFQQKHRNLTKLFRAIVSKPDVKWENPSTPGPWRTSVASSGRSVAWRSPAKWPAALTAMCRLSVPS